MTQRSLLVAVDFSETGTLAFDEAFRLAVATGSELHVANVVTPYGPMLRVQLPDDAMTATMEEAGAELQRWTEVELDRLAGTDGARPARVVAHLRVGSPAEEIAQLASDLEAELVVVGTHGRRGARRLLLGSVAEATVRLAPCPVLVVRPRQVPEVPAIEPPCPRCLEVRRATNGEQMWCDQHRQHRGRRHTYHFSGRTHVMGGSNPPLVVPKG